VNRRGVPKPIGTLSYWSTQRWRGHFWTLIHTGEHHRDAAQADRRLRGL